VIKARSHEATTTDGRDNQLSEARRKTITRMASERSGRNESERIGSPDTPENPEAELLHFGRRLYVTAKLVNTLAHSGGVVATARDA
jgi:hypothetical protein